MNGNSQKGGVQSWLQYGWIVLLGGGAGVTTSSLRVSDVANNANTQMQTMSSAIASIQTQVNGNTEFIRRSEERGMMTGAQIQIDNLWREISRQEMRFDNYVLMHDSNFPPAWLVEQVEDHEVRLRMGGL